MKLASLIFGDFDKIPPQWRTDFRAEWIETCLARMRILAWFTLIYPAIVSPVLYLSLSLSEPVYLSLQLLILVGIFLTSAFSLWKIYTSLQYQPSSELTKTQSQLILFYSITMLIYVNVIFCTIWLRTDLNVPYVIAIFLYALMFYQPHRLGTIIYGTNFILYLIFISVFPAQSFHHQSIAYFSGTVATLGGWYVATMLYNARIESFINNRTIQIQSQELQKVNEELKKLVAIDGLTQVANRRRFDQHLNTKYQELADTHNLAILLCDVDYFKLFNDTYGHQAGDECLQKVAATIQADIRHNEDLVARYGGEEFVIILCNTSVSEALQVAERICKLVQDLHIPHKRSPLQEVTISIGVFCQIPSLGTKPEQLITKADQALYLAKAQGRNQAVYATV
ncbi:diguanylate cyclase (GGDEF) domain-containing protein [Synechococcus sp. PCC 7502]|uniref:GGDEF domain-containing protein n=1 Tax=Synechococcus sp. PCC 7502 TaxID=1173263 RepID=UPI00029FAE3C|nr:diguanylate cyclase [Synechococcus sp. PCC 7502]AFY75346.1 diguanylate cyclase (GGDEF) domain-containing protein [Synechococcus sp. PCC 7502]